MTDPFRKIHSYQQLIRTNISFLKGEIKKTPYHGAPVDPETLPLLDDLIQINRSGFISICGQPAIDNIEFINKTWKVNGKTQGNWWVHTQQRSFIEGYILKEFIPSFKEFMKSQPDYVYRIYDFEMSKPTFFSRKSYVKTKYLTGFKNRLNLTKQKCSKTQKSLSEADENLYTNIPSVESGINPSFEFWNYPNLVELLIPQVVLVCIVCKEYGNDSVEQLLLKYFDSISDKN